MSLHNPNKRLGTMHTGRGGAILYTKQLYEALGKDPNLVNPEAFEDGTYSIKEGLLKYEGLWDKGMGTQVALTKVRGQWKLERWVEGFRADYVDKTEEEAQGIISKLKKS